MIYKKLGNTQVDVSVIGFGSARLPEYEMNGEWIIDEEVAFPLIKKALDLGINYFDTGYIYCHGQSQRIIGNAIRSLRKNVYISNKIMPSDIKRNGDFRKLVEKNLFEMGTDYIDFFYFWGINKYDTDEIILKYDLIKEAEKLKAEGILKHIGFSFHDSPEVLKYIIDRCGVMETVLCQYNLLDRTNELGMKYASEKGLGVLVMSPLAGGNLVAPKQFIKGKTGREIDISHETALKYVFANENVACVLTGVQNIKMLEENIRIATCEQSITDDEIQQVNLMINSLKSFSDLYCTGCNYCQPCPQNINVSRYFNQYNLAKVYGLTKVAIDDYVYFTNDEANSKVNSCLKCNICSKRCPQKLDVPNKLNRVDNFFKTLIRFYQNNNASVSGKL